MNKSLLLASLMAVALAACGKKEEPAPAPAPAAVVVPAAEAPAAAPAETAAAAADAAGDAATGYLDRTHAKKPGARHPETTAGHRGNRRESRQDTARYRTDQAANSVAGQNPDQQRRRDLGNRKRTGG